MERVRFGKSRRDRLLLPLVLSQCPLWLYGEFFYPPVR